MSGILDKKSRIFDFVITKNGRAQLEDNDIRYKYATFSDRSIVYAKDFEASSIKKADVTNSEIHYVPLEATSSGNDEINPEFDLRKYFFGSKLNPREGEGVAPSGFNFDDSVNSYIQQNSLGSYLQSLGYLRTKRDLNSDKTLTFFNNNTINKDIDLFSSTKNYNTVKFVETRKERLPVVALDRRFSHKRNFSYLPPKDISGNELYQKEDFNHVDHLSSENILGYVFPKYRSQSLNKLDIESSREKNILKIIKDLERNKSIHKKEFELENPTENSDFIFELYEVINSYDSLTPRNIIKSELEKLHFVNIGEFYDKENFKTKKLYLIGKFYNTREDTKELDVLFSMNNGQINLKSKDAFALCAFFSFVCLFTLVVE
jgi:hypothetical protein